MAIKLKNIKQLGELELKKAIKRLHRNEVKFILSKKPKGYNPDTSVFKNGFYKKDN